MRATTIAGLICAALLCAGEAWALTLESTDELSGARSDTSPVALWPINNTYLGCADEPGVCQDSVLGGYPNRYSRREDNCQYDTQCLHNDKEIVCASVVLYGSLDCQGGFITRYRTVMAHSGTEWNAANYPKF
jgi:hypothetical protein